MHRLGYGAMRLTGEGIWGPPKDRKTALAVLRRAVELGVNFIDTADSYGPYVNEELIAEALYVLDRAPGAERCRGVTPLKRRRLREAGWCSGAHRITLARPPAARTTDCPPGD